MSRVTLHVGTYAAAGGQGLYLLDYDDTSGFILGEPFLAATNASFGAWSARYDMHYLVEEQAMGAVGVYRQAGEDWIQTARISTAGREPCYVSLDPAEQRLAIANYGSGSVALYDLGLDGLPRGELAPWTNGGGGPNAERQEGPHIHCVQFSPDGRHLYAVDLGTDEVLRLPLNGSAPLEMAEIAWQAPPGSGPRHLCFMPGGQSVLLVSELASALTLLDITETGLAPRAVRSTLPAGFTGENLGGHLAISIAGNRAYVTNRGHDSVALFDIDMQAGRIEPIQHIASGGASPRHFLMLEELGLFFLANEQEGNVVAFRVGHDGRLSSTGRDVKIPGAVFLLRAVRA